MKTKNIGVCCAAVAFMASAAHAVIVTNTPSQICYLIPTNIQGSNGIRLQYRAVGTSDYTDLTSFGGVSDLWGTPGTAYNIPSVGLVSPGKWRVHPSAVTFAGFDRDTLIRVKIEGSVTSIKIEGGFGSDSSLNCWFYIYKGAGNWASPLWSSDPGGTFSFTTSCQDGDELFFATNAKGNDNNDWAFYQDVTITGLAFQQPIAPPTVSISASPVRLCWDTQTNTWFQLQYNSTLTTNQWVPLGLWLPGTGTTYCTNDVVQQSQRFYRVAVTNSLPQP